MEDCMQVGDNFYQNNFDKKIKLRGESMKVGVENGKDIYVPLCS